MRLAWIDVIRAAGAFLVVLAHVVLYPSLRGSGPLWAQSLYYTVSRVAVPLFFMASGFLLLGKQEGYSAFYRKRALRVFVPFLVWSFVYLAWNGGFSEAPFSLATVLDGLLRILRGPRASHLWFFYVLISLYLITPTLRIFVRHAARRDLVYFCGLWFLLDPVLNLVRHQFGVEIGFEFLFLTGYIGYYVLGQLLGNLTLTRWHVLGAALLMAAATAFVFLSVYRGSQAPDYDQFFEGYLSVPVVVMTAATFVIARWATASLAGVALSVTRAVSATSLGIYLLHVVVLDLLDTGVSSLLPAWASGSSIVTMLASATAAYFVCFAVVWGIQRVPVLRNIVP